MRISGWSSDVCSSDLVFACVPAWAAPGLTAPAPVGAYLNGVFPDTTPGSSQNATWTTRNAFPNLTFVEPVRIIEHPTQNKLLDRKRVGWGKGVTGRVEHGGGRILTKKTHEKTR